VQVEYVFMAIALSTNIANKSLNFVMHGIDVP
jgi:hypothetical protein